MIDVYEAFEIDRGPGGDLYGEISLGLFEKLRYATEHCEQHPGNRGRSHAWEGNLDSEGLTYGNFIVRMVPVAQSASRADIKDTVNLVAAAALQTIGQDGIDALRRAKVIIPDELLPLIGT